MILLSPLSTSFQLGLSCTKKWDKAGILVLMAEQMEQTGQFKINSLPQAYFVTFYKPRGSSFWSPLMLVHTHCSIKDSKLLHERQSTFCACKKISLVHWWHHTSLIRFPSNLSLFWLCSFIQSLWSAKALHSVIKKLDIQSLKH